MKIVFAHVSDLVQCLYSSPLKMEFILQPIVFFTTKIVVVTVNGLRHEFQKHNLKPSRYSIFDIMFCQQKQI